MSIEEENNQDSTQSEADESGPDQPPPVEPGFPFYTYLLAACIVVVAIVQFTTDGSIWETERSTRITGFIKDNFRHGEYWRILTGATAHINIIHIFFNSTALVSFGKLIELLSNRAHLATVFLISAIGGGIMSLILNPQGNSVGASGGIIGLLGYLVIYSMRRKQFLAPEFRRSLLFNTGFIVVYGIALYQIIDNYAHLGGFLAGAFYTLFQVPGDPHVDPRPVGTAAELVGLVSLGIFIAASIFSILMLTGFVG
jgi:membrane associated rhomboid family serine protease